MDTTQLQRTAPTAVIESANEQAQIHEVTTRFLSEIDVKPKSREIYTRNINGFFRWVRNTERKANQLTAADIVAYKNDLLAANYSPATIAGYIAAVRRFYEWANANGLANNIAAAVKPPKIAKTFAKQPLTIEQAGQLLRSEADTDRRDFALINLMVRAGLRCIEVSRANVCDITTLGGKYVLMVQGKGRDAKDNFVQLTPSTYEPIATYLADRKAKPNEPLFVSRSHNSAGKRLTTRAISGIAKNALQTIGLNNRVYTAHSLRHTAAVNVLRSGGSTEQAQRMLRHSNIQTTQIYTATLEQEQRLNNGGELLIENLFNEMLGTIEPNAPKLSNY